MDAVDAIKRILKGEKLVSLEDAFEIVENGSRLHGHVDAVLSAQRAWSSPPKWLSRPSYSG